MTPSQAIDPQVTRGALIDVHQLSNGYWACHLFVRIPNLPDQTLSGDSFHNAREALEWARMAIESTVAHAS